MDGHHTQRRRKGLAVTKRPREIRGSGRGSMMPSLPTEPTGLAGLTDRIDSRVRETLSGSSMSDESENSAVKVLAAIERARYERSEAVVKYDSAIAKLIAAGRDLGAEIPDDDRAPGAAKPEPGAELTADDRAPEAAKPEPGAAVWVDGPVPGSAKPEPGAELTPDDRAPEAAKPEPGAELTADDRAPEAAKPEPGAEVWVDGPVPGSAKPEPGAEVSLDGPVPEGKADQTNNNYLAGFNAYWWCHFRDHLHPMGWYRDCRFLSEQEFIKVSFSEDALDRKHGKNRWIQFLPRKGLDTLQRCLESVELTERECNTAPSNRTSPSESDISGIREGATKHRVLVITKGLLQDREEVPLQDILEAAKNAGEFAKAKDPTQYLHNILYQLKVKGLLTSDGHGNWSLPA
jgi:hypothetical protein